jgi:tetratricopeptide (TPR) repeat protein
MSEARVVHEPTGGAAVAGAVATGRGATPLDGAAVRDRFPLLRSDRDGGRLVYLDSAATAQRPDVVLEAIGKFYRTENANVHRGIYELSRRSTERYEGSRSVIARFLNAPSTAEVVWTRGTTEAVNLVASTWGQENIGRGDEILLTVLEHHSNIVPWQLLARRVGARLRYIDIDDQGRLRLDQGKREEARAAFRRVLQLDPQNQVALQYLGELAAEAGDLRDALEYYRRLPEVLERALVLRIELERAQERRPSLLTLPLVQPEPAQDDVGARVVGVQPEALVEHALGLGEAAGPTVGIGQVGEDEAFRMGCMKQLQPCDLITMG